MSYILITGASKNIGSEIAKHLAKEGHDLLLHYNTGKESIEKLLSEIKEFNVKADIIYGDFSSNEGLLEFVSLVHEKKILLKGIINSAAIYQKGSLLESDLTDFQKIFQVNLFASFFLIKSFLEDLKKTEGFIVNLGMAGLLSDMSGSFATVYNMSKLSLLMLTKSFAKELIKDRVSVNMISPGYTKTSSDLPKSCDNILQGRVAENREIAEGVIFFFKNRYITGQNLEIAGGVRL